MTEESRFILTRAGYEQLQRDLAEFQERFVRQQSEMEDMQQVSDEQFPEEGAEIETRMMRDYLHERITYLTSVLERAEIIDEDPDPRRIDPGDRVTVWSVTDGEEITYDLIGSAEAMMGREGISLDSPVGSALNGRQVGEVFDVETPEGMMRYAIRRVERMPSGE